MFVARRAGGACYNRWILRYIGHSGLYDTQLPSYMKFRFCSRNMFYLYDLYGSLRNSKSVNQIYIYKCKIKDFFMCCVYIVK